MMAKQLVELFRDVVTGCRDAADRKDGLRCKQEIELAWTMHLALEQLTPTKGFSEGIDQYQRYAEIQDDAVMKWRGDFYRSLLKSAGEVTIADVESSRSQHYSAFAAILRVGLLFAKQANECGDLTRVSIESDHIHNVPTYLTSDVDQSFNYYLEKERTYYLDRIEQHCGARDRLSVEEEFYPYWSSIAT